MKKISVDLEKLKYWHSILDVNGLISGETQNKRVELDLN